MENIINKITNIKVVYVNYLDVDEELADLYISELKKHYNQIEKSRWNYGWVSERYIIVGDRDSTMTKKSDELNVSKVTLYLNLLPENERERFLNKTRWYFANRDDVISILIDDEDDEDDYEKQEKRSLEIEISVNGKDEAKNLLKFYIRAIKYHYPSSTVKNYFPIVTEQDVKKNLENIFDDNRWSGEILLLIKQKKRNIVKISRYTWYKREKKLVLSLSCLPKSKQREFVKKVKQLLKDKTKIQVL